MKNRFLTGLAVAAMAFSLSGCVALMVGGAAAGGYMVGKDERTAGEMTDDAAITTAVKARLVRDDLVRARDINVDTFRKVVTLRGTVQSEEARRRAIELAAGASNVQRVIDELEIKAF